MDLLSSFAINLAELILLLLQYFIVFAGIRLK